ncbi:MAG: hypothetical protein IJS96_09095 [Schwartzia sp.]|nr:hypothetical protein [Schwartzia sp. (in: firmicutes)]
MKKRMAGGLVAAFLVAVLLAGCGGGGGQAAKDAAAPAQPAATAVTTPPAMTALLGQKEIRAYELTGVDLRKKIRTGRLVVMGDTIFFHGGTKPSQLFKATVKGETISNLTVIGESGSIDDLATNGQVVLYRSANDHHLAAYDGKTLTEGDDWPGEMAGVDGTQEFYYIRGAALKAGTFDGKTLQNVRDVIKNYKLRPELKAVTLRLVSAEANEVFLRCAIKKSRENPQSIPTLIAFNREGKEIRRYEGVEELPRGWAVTKDYIVHCGSKGMFRLINRANGQVLGDLRFNMRPFALCAMEGNQVLVYDDRSEKLYRIDFQL